MLKKYIANSCISLSVRLQGGATHVSFVPRSSGGSVYYTENEAIQEGLEKHPHFGKLFRLDNIPEAPDSSAEAFFEEAKSVVTPVHFECNEDAKDYLADKFGVSRSKMRSRSDIEKVAEENNVKIMW